MIGNDYRAEKLKKEQVIEDYREPIFNRYAEEEYPRTLGPEVKRQMTLVDHLQQQTGILDELDKCIHALEDRISPIVMGHPVDTAKEKEAVSNDSQVVATVRHHNSYITHLIERLTILRNNIQL